MKTQRPISEHAAVAKAIRKELKRNGIKASVRSESYSGGSSVRVEILEDVLPATFQAIRDYTRQYEKGHFDGMQDMYIYSNRREDLPQVQFTFVDMNYSDKITQDAIDYLVENHADYSQYKGIRPNDRQPHDLMLALNRVLEGDFMPEFWTARKPHIARYKLGSRT